MEPQFVKNLVLVSGATGFVASHVIKELLAAGYYVRGTVRKVSDTKKYEHLLKLPGATTKTLTFVEADLTKAASWEPACSGCQFVMHVASPFPAKVPKDEVEEVIKPAVDGTINVLKAAVKAGVKKVVVTSSVASIMYGHGKETNLHVFDESNWSVVEQSPPYEKSKTLAEKALWAYYEQVKDKIEITTINPGVILGPFMSDNSFTSVELVQKLMANSIPGLPQMAFPIADVRDVARAHLLALENPKTSGRRYIVVTRTLWVKEIADILKKEFGKQGYKFPSLVVGRFPVVVASWFDPTVKMAMPNLGMNYQLNNRRSQEELNLEYTPVEQTVIEMAYSLIEHKIIPDKRLKLRPLL